ncbi:MAG: hypothetical protein AB8F78_00340 [Saprospiraceae bacterium]
MKLYASLFLLLSSLAFGFSASAQGDETLVDKFTLDLSGAWGGWHLQTTNIGGNNTLVNGGFGGVEFNKTVFVGWSAYGVSDNLIDDNENLVPYNYSYNGPIVAYTPRARSVVHPKISMQVGFGKYEVANNPTDRFLVLQPGIGGEVNILRWFRAGATAGYRYSLNSDYGSDSFGNTDGFFLEGTLKFGFSWGTN